MMNTMNLQDNQQYVPSAGDNVDVVNIGRIDIESIQSDVDLYLKKFHKNGSLHSIHVLRH
jgi:hypothetical protein